jgi:CheY-like chemotaxis protein
MHRVRLFHWRAEEAKPLIAALRAGGYTVEYPGDKANGNWRSLRERPQPAAAVIDLTRLPSHGRYVAAEIRASKSMRQIPIVFVDGDPDKVEAIRKALPDAVYTSRASLLSALKRVKPLLDPVVPPRMMTRTDRTAAEKLGIKAGARVALVEPPVDYLRVLGKLPKDVSLEEDPEEALPLTLCFVREPEAYLAGLADIRKRALRSRIWIIYPKQQARQRTSGLTQGLIREAALAVGLVDYKVCSVNEVWTGLLFTVKK